ncbi:MAG: gliding motility protein GldM [Bacteroidetes bacterium]|nr:MAG: gliding motility protein GldM [Bacteroidota bacterium]
MAGGKLSPRQKMINMMYLVLTALLAMNVSKEILNSFALLNNGLVKTNTNFTAKNEVTYSNFETAELNDPNKVRGFHDKAKAVKKRSQEMFDYIEVLKAELIKDVEEKEETEILGRNGQDSTIKIISNVLYMEAKDDNAKPTHYFMGDKDNAEPGNKAYEFKDKIKKFKEDLKTFIPEKERKNITLGLETEDVYSSSEDMMISWESNNFYHNPAIAVIALLTKMQNDVKNAEADIINALYKQIDVSSFKFDTLSARVVANSNYVLLGDEYRAEVFMAAFSTTSNPQVWLGEVDSVKNEIVGPKDTTSVKVSKGVGIYSISPSAEGTVQWGGIIRMKDPADPTIYHAYPFKSEFKAARPAIVVSPDKMNVLYVGLDNPVSVSVPGIAAEDLQPSLSGGSLSGSRGKYIAKVAQTQVGKEVTVNVSAKTKNGVKSMGQGVKFRVKAVPNPVGTVYGKRMAAFIKQGELQFLKGVVPAMDDFQFELKIPVISFDVSMNVGGLETTIGTKGPSFSEAQLALIRKAKKNNKIYIEKIMVQKPGGAIVEISGVNLRVQ